MWDGETISFSSIFGSSGGGSSSCCSDNVILLTIFNCFLWGSSGFSSGVLILAFKLASAIETATLLIVKENPYLFNSSITLSNKSSSKEDWADFLSL